MAFATQPKLILQITVDQLRGNLPDKFMKNMGDIFKPVKPNDIAATLSAIVNAKAPSGSNGDILEEVLEAVK